MFYVIIIIDVASVCKDSKYELLCLSLFYPYSLASSLLYSCFIVALHVKNQILPAFYIQSCDEKLGMGLIIALIVCSIIDLQNSINCVCASTYFLFVLKTR